MNSNTASIAAAQAEMREAYYGGAVGVFVSGTAWATAGLVALFGTAPSAVWTLLIGGMLIHPVSVLLLRAIGRTAKHTPGNPFASLAMATTVWLIVCCVLAYAVSLLRIEWFFPAMLLVIGGRYMTFATVYGTRLYWAFGAALVLAGWGLGSAQVAPAFAALTGAAIEAAFGLALVAIERRENRAEPERKQFANS